MRKKIILATLLLLCLLTGCTKNVKDKPITITFQEKTYEGKYTGVMEKGVPIGEGQFNYSKDGKNLKYTGGFENGQFSGKGNLEADMYTVNFESVDRTGKYTGETFNGEAKGQGTFEAMNDDKVKYKYEGQWDKGIFNGQGTLTYETSNYNISIEKGNFLNGNFKPSIKECIYVQSTDNSAPCNMDEKSIKFLEEHENLFPVDSYDKISEYVDPSIEFKHLQKFTDTYGEKLVKVEGRIIQAGEADMWGHIMTTMIIMDKDYNFYYVYYYGKCDYYESDMITLFGLPMGQLSYESKGDKKIYTHSIIGSYIGEATSTTNKATNNASENSNKIKMTSTDEKNINDAIDVCTLVDKSLNGVKTTYWIEKAGNSANIVINFLKPAKELPADFDYSSVTTIPGALSVGEMSVEYEKVVVNFVDGDKVYHTEKMDRYKGK